MTAAQRGEARVELRHSRGARPTVEVRHAESIPTPLEVAVEKQVELAQMEDRLAGDGAGPFPRAEPSTESRRSALELTRLVLEHPAGRVESHEEARMRAPAARAHLNRGPPERTADGCEKAAGASRDCHRQSAVTPAGSSCGSKALEVCVDEKLHEAVEVERRRPPETLACLRRVPDEVMELRRPAYQRLIDANVLLPVETGTSEGALDELADAVGRPGRDDVVVWLGLLEHEPHRLDVIGGVTPVAAGLEVAQRHLALEAEADRSRSVGHLPRHEVEWTPRGLVVVEDPGGRVQPVLPAIAPGDEVRIRLRDAVRRDGREWRVLVLRHLSWLAEDLARGRLVEANLGVDTPDRLEERRTAHRGELRGQHRLTPRHGHERRGCEVVDLVRTTRRQDIDERQLVEHIGLRELELVADRREVLEPRRHRLADDAEDAVALREEMLGEQRAVLTRDADDECATIGHPAPDLSDGVERLAPHLASAAA